jgi:glutamine amidotransferase
VLPGVGNFAAGMTNLTKLNLADYTVEWAAAGKPLLGICMGMQLFFEESDEGPFGGTPPESPPKITFGGTPPESPPKITRGLGIFEGRVERFDDRLKVPHMGWNTVRPVGGSPIFEDFDGRHFYFVHSYYCKPAGDFAGARTGYGIDFCSAIHFGNVVGVQFHPEKSSDDGLELLRRMLKELAP